MKLKYVSNKSKFIDLDAARPRLMNLETVTKLLELHGIHSPEEVLVKVMANPIIIEDKLPAAPLLKIVEQYQIVAENGRFTVQGVWFRDYNDVLSYLVGRRKIPQADALRALALALDIADMNK